MQKVHHIFVAPLLAIGLGLVGATPLVLASPMPLPKVGSCPLGYYSSGSYCVPSERAGSREAIQKSGSTCPLGWYSSGNYCMKSR